MQNKAFLTPVWILSAIIVWEVLTTLLTLRMLTGINISANLPIIIFFFLWPAVLLLEVIVYWVIRKRVYNRRWAWMHILFCLGAFVLLKILYFIANMLLPIYQSPNDISHTLRMANNIHLGAFYSFLLIGHASFVAVLIQAFSKNKQPIPEATPSGIFDEIH